MDTKKLYTFIQKAASATYAGGGAYEKSPERPGFMELVYDEGDFSYRDSYAGYYRSAGSEVVRHRGKIVWIASYCGGMVAGSEELADKTFDFLKRAMRARPENGQFFRGPAHFAIEQWHYIYEQKGDVISFYGHEEIWYRENPVFSHDVIGGTITGK